MSYGRRLLVRMGLAVVPQDDIFEMRLRRLGDPWPLRARKTGVFFRTPPSRQAA